VVQMMVASGLLKRTPRAGDRRAINLRLTEAGTSLLAAWQAANDRRLGHALERLPQSYRDAIDAAVPALAALAALLETDDQLPNPAPARPNGKQPRRIPAGPRQHQP
jgi:DNA-binding MarR family transcriptional regulator